MTKGSRRMLFCVSAAVFSLGIASPLLAQGKSDGKIGEITQKLIAESDKIRVYDIVQRPGDSGPVMSRFGSFIYVVDGGSIERTYADGSKVVVHRKAGDSILNDEKRPYSVKNVGETTIHLIVVQPK